MRLNQVTLPVRDMDTTAAFYRTLGFTQIVDTPHYARFECPGSDGQAGSTFSLSLDDGDFRSGAVIYFEHNDLHDWVKELEGKGIIFDQQPTMQRYLWEEAVLRDPSGNKIKLYRAGENRLNPPWRVERKE